ncbi:MAG: NAD(P)-dependent oxidoreductase [Alphaproteobacteria bacterium]|nr:NAD(P)-dependent oxidoreductase [Alphaproteobacteria bacterium]
MADFKKIGFIGTGVMGGRMCRNLATKIGVPVIAYDRDPKNVAALADAGVIAAASVAEIAAEADLIILCLPGEPQVRAVCLGENEGGNDGLLVNVRAGQTIVDMTTATAGVAREVAEKFAEKSVDFADAPIAKGVSAAQDGTLSIMVGASKEVFDRIHPAMSCMGAGITHCGDIGAGQVMKLMNNMVVFMNTAALAEALAIGRRAGVDGELLFETLSKGSADSFVLRKHGMEYMMKDNFPDDVFPVTYSLKDVGYALKLADELGVDAKSARVAQEYLKAADDAGYGKLYGPVIYKVIDK